MNQNIAQLYQGIGTYDKKLFSPHRSCNVFYHRQEWFPVARCGAFWVFDQCHGGGGVIVNDG